VNQLPPPAVGNFDVRFSRLHVIVVDIIMKSTVLTFLLLLGCRPYHTADVALPENAMQVSTVPADPLDFAKDIQPILESHCRPCHFKDGKMYQRMPFDQSKTLVDFQEGILRRMKDEGEAKKIREYLARLK
jgi:hypothetical protein